MQGSGFHTRLPPRPSSPVLREAQKYVRSRLEKKWVKEFVESETFLTRNASGLRDRPSTVLNPKYAMMVG